MKVKSLIKERVMQYSLEKYKNTYAVYAYRAECYVLFGNKKDMQKAVDRLNKMDEKSDFGNGRYIYSKRYTH